MGHPLAGQAECAVILSFGRNGEDQLTPIWHRHQHFTTEHSFYQFHLHICIEVVSLALKRGIGIDANHQKKVTALPTTNPRLSFARDTNLWAIINARGDFDLNPLVAWRHPLPTA